MVVFPKITKLRIQTLKVFQAINIKEGSWGFFVNLFFKYCTKNLTKPHRSRGSKPSSLSPSDDVTYVPTMMLLELKHTGQIMTCYAEIYQHQNPTGINISLHKKSFHRNGTCG